MSKQSLIDSLQNNLICSVKDFMNGGNSKTPLKRLKVIYIDDDERNSRSFYRLAKFFFDIKVFKSFELVKEVVSSEKIDLILFDYKLSKSNGIDEYNNFIKSIKSIPLIIVTGFSKDAISNPSYEFEKIEIIEKPFSIEDILNSSFYQKALNYNSNI